MTLHRMCFFVIGISAMFLFSGCTASKNMLADIFGNAADTSSVLDAATHENRSITSPDAAYRLARHFQKQGRHRLAVEQLLNVVQAAPDHANAYNALGVSYDQLREFAPAAAAYREALKINPDLAYVHNNIGYSHLLQGNVEAAADAFETAVSLDREKLQYKNNLTLAYARLGKDQPAPAQPDPDLSQPAPPAAMTASVPDQDPVKIVRDTITMEDLPENDTPTPALDNVCYTIQLGVFYDLDKAMAALRKAQADNLDTPYITKVDRGESYKPYYRLRAGKFQDRAVAKQRAAGISTHTPMPAYVTQETGRSDDFFASAQPRRVTRAHIKPVIIKSNADIEILNGNGVRHMARGVQQYLAAQGMAVDRIANASHFFHPRTIIYYTPGFYGQAKQILDRFHDIDATGKMVKSSALNTGIRIVLGRDVAPVADQLGHLMKKEKPLI